MAEQSVTEKEIYDHPGLKTKSQVWKFFGFHKKREDEPPTKSNLDLTQAVCRLCKKSYKNTGNTTNFRIHIDSTHKLFDAKPKEPKAIVQPKLSCVQSRSTTMGTVSKQRGDVIDTALQKLVVGKVLPPSLVENEHFINLMKEMDPRYKLPGRNKLMSSLKDKKKAIQDKMKANLACSKGVGVTHDGWTSANTESYNTTTVHYIDEEWNMKAAVLSTKKIEGSHTSEKIAQTLQEVKTEWALPDLVATTDNAANEVKAFQILKWQRFGCYGHRFNLVVTKALEKSEISKLLGKGRRLVTLMHSSSSVNDMFKEKQALLLAENVVGHKLIGDVPTRWNSTLFMLKRLVEQTPALMALATEERINKSSRTTIKNCLYTF